MSKEKLLLVGAGGFGRVVLEHASLKYDCAFVDDGYIIGDIICGTRVVGHISDIDVLRKDFSHLLIVIGNNEIRQSVYKKAQMIGYDFPNIICPSVYVSPFAKIGWGCVFLNNAVIQNGATVGNGVLLNPGVELHHDCIVDDYALIYTNSVIRTYAKIGKRVRIGSNVTISNDIIVPDDSDIPNGSTLF